MQMAGSHQELACPSNAGQLPAQVLLLDSCQAPGLVAWSVLHQPRSKLQFVASILHCTSCHQRAQMCIGQPEWLPMYSRTR